LLEGNLPESSFTRSGPAVLRVVRRTVSLVVAPLLVAC
jgi:hypothetical protein